MAIFGEWRADLVARTRGEPSTQRDTGRAAAAGLAEIGKRDRETLVGADVAEQTRPALFGLIAVVALATERQWRL